MPNDSNRPTPTDVPAGDPVAVERLIGIYHANGTIWGELSYWVGARFGAAHCSLCDITHGLVREKPEWAACNAAMPVTMTTVHLDERDDPLKAFTDGATPCVVAETAAGFVMLVDDEQLGACDGSPECLVAAIERSATERGLALG